MQCLRHACSVGCVLNGMGSVLWLVEMLCVIGSGGVCGRWYIVVLFMHVVDAMHVCCACARPYSCSVKYVVSTMVWCVGVCVLGCWEQCGI